MTGLARSAATLIAAAWLFSDSAAVAVGTTYNIPGDPIPPSLGAGDIINLGAGGVLPSNFLALAGSTININGGSIGNELESSGAVNLYSGSIGLFAAIKSGGVLSMYDGTVNFGWVLLNAEANVYGGLLRAHAYDEVNNSTIRMYGGEIETQGLPHVVDFESFFDMYGGTVGNVIRFQFGRGRFTGTSFLRDGAPIPGLTPGSSITFDKTVDATITGVLLDGKPFTAILDPDFQFPGFPIWDYEVTLVLVPEPESEVLLGVACVVVLFASGRVGGITSGTVRESV